jgi:hypothetical protein
MKKPTRPVRPKWLHSPISIPYGKHGKTYEMVSLPKTTLFSKIPAETQMDIISYLGYRDVLRLRATCRYYNYFIDRDMVQEVRVRQIETFEEMEKQKSCGNSLPCYTCLALKPLEHFWNATRRHYYQVGYVQDLVDPTERYCIPCGFRTKKFERGLRLTVAGVTRMLCPGCSVLVREHSTATGYYGRSGNTCEICRQQWSILWAWGWIVRFFQFAVGIIIFALSCTGQSVPNTSVVSKHSYRFIFTALLVRQ